MSARHDRIVKEIRNYDSSLASQICDWYPVGDFEVVLILDDGSKVQYEGLNHTYRWLPEYVERSEGDDDLLTEEEYKREFAYKLNRLMVSNGYGQADLAKATGISQSAISKYTRGDALPGYYNLIKFSRVLNCSVSELTTHVR